MPKALFHPIAQVKRAVPRLLASWRRELVGIAQDYWKDGRWEKSSSNDEKNEKKSSIISHPPSPEGGNDLWHALPGEVSEKMWGSGFVMPGDDDISRLLLDSLNATKEMRILDLSAGLGGRLRQASQKYGVVITGWEPDRDIAKRGMDMLAVNGLGQKVTITAYDPMTMQATDPYDCVLARETIYRVADKEKFIKSVAGYCKPQAQVSFTDYILNGENREQPAIAAWRQCEQDADPCSLIDMAALWGKAGFKIHLHEDQTEFYMKEIKQGLLALAQFLASGVKPDAETKAAIKKHIALWAHRRAALAAGMKFYRFHGTK